MWCCILTYHYHDALCIVCIISRDVCIVCTHRTIHEHLVLSDAVKYGHQLYKARKEAEGREAEHPHDDRLLCDMQDGDLFDRINADYPNFMKSPWNFHLGLTTDGFNPFDKSGAGGHKQRVSQAVAAANSIGVHPAELPNAPAIKDLPKGASTYSLTPLTITVFNLPPYIRTRLGALHVAGIAPGPNQKQLQSYLEPLVDELLYLWFFGSASTPRPFFTSDQDPAAVPGTSAGEQATHTTPIVKARFFRAMLVHVIGDYRGTYVSRGGGRLYNQKQSMSDAISMP
jgi:hypothetical protein